MNRFVYNGMMIKLPRKARRITGQKFGRLTAIKPSNLNGGHHISWLFLCDCGAKVEARGAHVWSGRTVSCGCYRTECARSAAKHGHARQGEISKTFVVWNSMLDRCRNKNNHAFARYGGRGISVCKRWGEFKNFLADMGERPSERSLDRIDNNGNYGPDNCRWATRKEQSRNKKNNRPMEMDGRTKLLCEWIEEYDANNKLVWSRLKMGWTLKEALTEPLHVNQYTRGRCRKKKDVIHP